MKPWTKSLKARLVSHFLLLSLMIAALAGFLAFLGGRKALEQSVFERLTVTANLEEDHLRQWVENQRRDVVFIASSSEIRNLSRALLKETVTGQEKPSDLDRLRQVLVSTLTIKTHLKEILLLSNVGGRIVVSTDRDHEGEYRVRDNFFIQGQHRTFVQNVYPSPLELAPTLTIATPVFDTDGERLGVLAAHINLDELDFIIRDRADLGTTGATYLIDRYNDFVSATRFGRDQYPRGVHTEGIDAAAAGLDGSGLYLDYTGVPVLGVYRWIEDLELALLVEISQHEAFAPARRIAGVITGVGIALALLLTAGTILLAEQIARPIRSISDASLRVADGDLTVDAPVLTDDEIGVLAQSFNTMTARLRTLYGELKAEIAERRETQEELETKNAELERFTYTVSHDLKSPLVTIKGFLGMLEKDIASGQTERTRSDLERIRGAADTMAQLLNELLELSRVGRQVNPTEEVALGDLALEATELLSGEIASHGLEVEIAPDLPTVAGDRVRLLEVFQNLLGNAAKFMGDQSDPRIEVGARRQGDERICFVRDNGMGIHPDYHEKIFGLFERLDGQVEGTGVGLALVKRIVEWHGGRIWVESRGEGHGATFCLTLGAVSEALPELDA